MRVAVGKIDGVRDVKVSLNEGLATIQFAPSNHVSIDQVRKAIRSNGFTPRGADVRVAGTLETRGDTVFLTVPQAGDSFLLRDAAGASDKVSALRNMKSSGLVQLEGNVPELQKGAARGSRPTLFVRSFKAE